jgi:hypothetical protein
MLPLGLADHQANSRQAFRSRTTKQKAPRLTKDASEVCGPGRHLSGFLSFWSANGIKERELGQLVLTEARNLKRSASRSSSGAHPHLFLRPNSL